MKKIKNKIFIGEMDWKHIQHWFLEFHSIIRHYQWNRGVVDEYLCTPFGIAPPLTSVDT